MVESLSGEETGNSASKTVGDRLTYGSEWDDLDHSEEEKVWSAVTAQADTAHYRKNLHSLVAEWIDQNYILYMEKERLDPNEDAFEVETVRVRVRATQHGHSVYLDVPCERGTVAEESYTGSQDLGYVIDNAVEEFAANRGLFTRGVLSEVENDDKIDPARLRGIDRHVYESVAQDFGRRYLRTLEDRIPCLVKVERDEKE